MIGRERLGRCRIRGRAVASRRSPAASCFVGMMALAAACLAPGHASAKSWSAGGLTFSVALGGGRLLSASGSGSRDDPIVLVEEISGAGPAILVVHNDRTGRRVVSPAQGFLALAVVKIIVNRGPWSWAGFDLELRRRPDEPSIYTDGLSFDQPHSFARVAKADRFAQAVKDDEPFDRIRFDGGNVAPAEHLRLDFDIVDVNGTAVFYLVQQPIVLFARQEQQRRAGRLTALADPP